jgi:hypothetical protein
VTELDPLLYDMADALAHADDPTPFMIDPIAVRGTLAVLVGKHSSMKSWLMIAACAAAARGGAAVGALLVEAGGALYVDAEMGARQMAKRWRTAGLGDDAFLVCDGFQLRLPNDQERISELIEITGAQLVIFDSLRRLAPGIREDKSDDVSPIMAALAEMSRDLDVAIVLIHHRSTKTNSAEVRGSSAIEDQADLVFALERVDGDPEEDRRRLRPIKFRVDTPPPAKWMRLSMIEDVFTISTTVPFETSSGPRPRWLDLADEAELLIPEMNDLTGWPLTRLRERLGIGRGWTADHVVHELRLRDWRLTGATRGRRIHPPPVASNGGEP